MPRWRISTLGWREVLETSPGLRTLRNTLGIWRKEKSPQCDFRGLPLPCKPHPFVPRYRIRLYVQGKCSPKIDVIWVANVWFFWRCTLLGLGPPGFACRPSTSEIFERSKAKLSAVLAQGIGTAWVVADAKWFAIKWHELETLIPFGPGNQGSE